MCELTACELPDCDIPFGLCHCGCGTKTNVSREHRPERKIFRGEPLRWARGHAVRGLVGEEHPAWKGGRFTASNGYIYVSVSEDHPLRQPNGYAAEHRIVMMEKLGRPLLGDENVHHINEIKDDNRPENLELLDPSTHGQRHFGKLDDEKVREVRRMLAAGTTQRAVAAHFNVCQATIAQINTGRWWKHVA